MTTPQTQSSPPLPLTMPRLTGRDICRGHYSDGAGRHCLGGWRDTLVEFPSLAWVTVDAALRKAAGGVSPVKFNDDESRSRDCIAAAWNAMPPLLGYVLSPDKSHFIMPEQP